MRRCASPLSSVVFLAAGAALALALLVLSYAIRAPGGGGLADQHNYTAVADMPRSGARIWPRFPPLRHMRRSLLMLAVVDGAWPDAPKPRRCRCAARGGRGGRAGGPRGAGAAAAGGGRRVGLIPVYDQEEYEVR